MGSPKQVSLFDLKREPGALENDKLRLKCLEAGLSEMWEYVRKLEARVQELENQKDSDEED
jgi:hypothetical protein